MTDRIVGVVLAAGEGRRLGGPKALVRLRPDGPTLLESAIATLTGGGIGTAHVVLGASAPATQQLLVSLRERAARGGLDLSWSVVEDWQQGMSVSFIAGLEWVGSCAAEPDAAVLHVLDLPGVTPAAVRRVVATSVADAGGDARMALGRAVVAGGPTHPVVIGAGHRNAVLDAVRLCGGDAGARSYLRYTPHSRVEVCDIASADDIDTPADLAVAARRWVGLSLEAVLDNA